MPYSRDLTCVIHAHSRYSDGTGTVGQIAAAGARARADAVLLTDHDSLAARRRGEERWYGSTLLCVGTEVSPRGRNHYLAFGIDEEIDHRGMGPADIVAAVRDAGGFGFLAHPFSRGAKRFRISGMPWETLGELDYTGIELWSFVTDTLEAARSIREVARFVATPQRTLVSPPASNLEVWDSLCQTRPVVAIGGIDAHQVGLKVGGHVPLRLMGYQRSFRHLRTHVLLDRPVSGDATRDRDAIFDALRAGRCYLAVDSLADATGSAFEARGREAARMGEEVSLSSAPELVARTPRPAALTLLCAGRVVASARSDVLSHRPQEPGAYRVEAALEANGRVRTWVLSNPIYVR